MRGSTSTLKEYTVEEALKIFQEAGFTKLEMARSHLLLCKTHQLRQGFAAHAKQLGLSMGCLNAVGENYFEPFGTDEQKQRSLSAMKGDMEMALSLGTTDLMIWEGRAPEGTTESDWLNRLCPQLIELFGEFLAFAAAKGGRLLVEPHPFTVGMSDRVLVRLSDALASEHFGITFDFCHYGVGRSRDYLQAIRTLGPRIRHLHLADSDLETSEVHLPPGGGKLDIQSILAAFKEIGYSGNMALDLYDNPIPVHGIRGGISHLRQACEFLGIES